MLGKATQLEPNITGISRDFKRARYQKLAFVEIYILIHGASRASKYICPAQPGIYEFRAAVRVAHEALNKYMPRVPKARVVYMFRRTRGPVYKVYIPESAEHGNKLIT